jgi:hypothetical protein
LATRLTIHLFFRCVGGADGTRTQENRDVERREESRSVTKSREDEGPERTPATLRDVSHRDPDEALKLAIKSAVDADDLDRAEALIAVLRRSPSKVVELASARRRR